MTHRHVYTSYAGGERCAECGQKRPYPVRTFGWLLAVLVLPLIVVGIPGVAMLAVEDALPGFFLGAAVLAFSWYVVNDTRRRREERERWETREREVSLRYQADEHEETSP